MSSIIYPIQEVASTNLDGAGTKTMCGNLDIYQYCLFALTGLMECHISGSNDMYLLDVQGLSTG